MSNEKMVRLGFERALFRGDHHADRWEALRHVLWYMWKQRNPQVLERMKNH